MRPNIKKPELKKINDFTWEIPTSYKQGMKVPARIIASKELLDDMDSAVFDQVSNVSSLPGVINYAMCMADGHSGYGFPIGGVAAMDPEKGVISPGGIGFDINCLVKDSNILTGHGYKKPIQDFESDFIEIDSSNSPYTLKTINCQQMVLSFDPSRKSFSSKKVAIFMKKKHFGSIYQIKTRLGYTIKVTGDHPILTKNGMVQADNLEKGQEISVYPFEGVNFEEISSNENLIRSEIFTKQEKDELKKRDLLNLKLSNQKIPIITKLFGYLLGDGSIFFSGKKGFVCAYGPEEDLKAIQEDFKTLGFSAGIYSRKRKHDIPTKYGNVKFETRNFELHVSSNALTKLFFELGYPQGTKTITSFLIPEWILDSPLWVKRLFLSGFFGAELSTPRTHTKTGFDCPTISMNKNSDLLDNGREFCIQMIGLLEEFGVNSHKLLERKDFKNRFGPTHRLKLQISSEENNLLRLWSKIGFSYNKKRETLSHIAIEYIKEKKLLTKTRRNTSIKIKELRKKGLRVKEVQKLLETPDTNKRFIHRHYYEDVGQRITLSFSSFVDFVKKKQVDIEKYGTLFDSIESISKNKYEGEVYDFNIPETHNFIADNVVVSNCGMRLVKTNILYKDLKPKIKDLVNTLFDRVPAGVGSSGFVKLDQKEFRNMTELGAKWAVDKGYGWEEDLHYTEEEGCVKGADQSKVSDKAVKRGVKQIGTLGSGNHYLELQVVKDENIADKELAKKFGLFDGRVVVMFHCGSRGFGHQVATDYLKLFLSVMKSKYDIDILDRELACAPFNSKEGQDYFKAMKCGINMSFANRQAILHQVRESFSKVFNTSAEDLGMHQVYDVAHNTAKLENHLVNGKKQKVLVHRKGATRAFGPGRSDIPDDYKDIGQPVIIGGSMETGSYLLVGTEEAEKLTFASTVHGSGRKMSRTKARKLWRGQQLQKDLEKRGIYIKTTSYSGLAEEAGGAYKEIDEVIEAVHNAGISKKVAKFVPVGNIKG